MIQLNMINVLIIFGTRPEAIKMAPVVKTLQKNNNIFDVKVCVTAQHRDLCRPGFRDISNKA